MANQLKNTLIYAFVALMFAVMGVFFVGCGSDTSNVYVSCDVDTVNLEVGETQELTFTIENYSSSFSNQVQVNPYFDGTTSLFSVSDVEYVSSSKFTVTITALAGGSGTLNVVTLQGKKECSVPVSIVQYSSSLSFTDDLLYVSNTTSFTPSHSNFTFDVNTTEKDVTYYCLVPTNSQIDIESGYTLTELRENGDKYDVKFVAENDDSEADRTAYQFDEMTLNSDNSISLGLDGKAIDLGDEETAFSGVSSLLIVAIYNGKDDSQTDFIWDIKSVYVLPDLTVNVTGGYLATTTTDNEGAVTTITTLNLSDVLDGETLIVSPNYSSMSEYIIRIERANVSSDTSIVTNFVVGDDGINVQYLSSDEISELYDINTSLQTKDNGANVEYLRILSSTQIEDSIYLNVSCYYEVAQKVKDESVNVSLDLEVDVKIAPTSILVNENSDPEKMIVYKTYSAPDFGWNDLYFEVISNYATSPNVTGIYFTYSENLQLTQNNVTVRQGSNYIYSDLDTPFKVRGYGSTGEASITVYVYCDWADFSFVTLVMEFDVLTGVTAVSYTDDSYSAIYMDANAGTQDFYFEDDSGKTVGLYADAYFQSLSFELLSGTDVASFWFDADDVCDEEYNQSLATTVYFLNFSITPKTSGTGIYRIYTDNGTSVDITISVIYSLSDATISLASDENEAVSYYYYTENSVEGAISKTLHVEVLNSYSNGELETGKAVVLQATGSFTPVSLTSPLTADYSTNDGSFSSITTSGTSLTISTLANGNATIQVEITGYLVSKFKSTQTSLTGTIYLSAYSLVENFYLKNGDDYALSSSVYYGPEDTKSVTFTPYADEDASNFYMYKFTNEALNAMFQAGLSAGQDTTFAITSSNFDQYITQELVTEEYNQKFIFYFANTSKGTSWGASKIDLTFTYLNGNVLEDLFTITVSIYSGLMFYVELDTYYTFANAEYAVLITTTNVYETGNGQLGTFDVAGCTYTQTVAIGENEVVISASIEQRNGTLKRYDAHIYVQNYQYAENITLISGTSEISFSSTSLTTTVNVLVYPTTATNPTIHLEYVPDDANYANLISWSYVDNGNGSYTITLSCKRFYESTSNIEQITDSLSGTLYIYPTDWGSSHSELGYLVTDSSGTETEVSVQPIEISINYQNGSKANPYLLSTAEDVLNINSNSSMLASHYRITSRIDMSGVTDATPIGILAGTDQSGNVVYSLVGFSGSITGTTSQAAIVNIDASNWTKTVGGITYSGLFAQLNSSAEITNVSFSGSVSSLTLTSDNASTAYVSILTGINFGTLTSVGVEVDTSKISAGNGVTLYFGAVAAINYGIILQDFTLYESGAIYSNLSTKNLAYFNDELTITGGGTSTVIYAGGIVGANAGLLERIESDELSLYGTSRYAAYTLITIVGDAKTIYLGGAAGVASGIDTVSADIIPVSSEYYVNDEGYSASILENLLVGGEISTLAATVSSTDGVGGIAGYIRSGGQASGRIYYLTLKDCTSRVFVRGHNFVGSVIGIDYCVSGQVGQVDFLTLSGNTSQAINDGRGGIWASMVIKTSVAGVSNASSLVTGTNGGLTDTSLYYYLEIYASVGNSYATNSGDLRATTVYTDAAFTVTSYLSSRTKTNASGVLNDADDSIYYGDVVVLSSGDVSTASVSLQQYFTLGDATISTEETTFQMTNAAGTDYVYFMTYFSVTSDVSGEKGTAAQEDISLLNTFSPNSSLYPFKITENDVIIKSSSSSVLSITSAGVITLKGTGTATISLYSILDQTVSLKIYVYVIDYFDTQLSSSMFRTGTSIESVQITDDFEQVVYGNSYATIYAVPTYSLSATDYDGNEFYITEDGLLFYKNVWYYLSKTSAVEVSKEIKASDEEATTCEVTGTTITFQKNGTPTDGDSNVYTLTPYISVEVNKVVYKKELSDASVKIKVTYHDAATQILTNKEYVSFQTSQDFSCTVSISSSRDSENLFYEIYKADESQELVQWRLPSNVSTLGTSLLNYLNLSDEVYYNNTSYSNYYSDLDNDDLFLLEFDKVEGSGKDFTFTCKVNKESDAYLNDYDNIFGKYTIVFYSSELLDGVSCSMTIELLEPELSYVSVVNYSNINSMSKEDETIVPTQRGVLEITIDPSDAVFNTFTISNNSINTGTAIFALALETESAEGGVEFVVQSTFGTTSTDGSFSFTYSQLLALVESANGVEYYGRFYISYLMPSSGLSDGEEAGFDIEVTYGSDVSYETSIFMNIKLSSYARLVFDDKEAVGDYYYLARGLSYSLTLDTHNFTSADVTFTIDNNELGYVTLTENNGSYTLSVTSANIVYPSSSEDGYLIQITTTASKIVDNIEIETTDVLKIYLMDFVLNYSFAEGVNEDIVSGMEDGVISVAVGNKLELELDIFDFIEYNSSLTDVVTAVNAFVDDLNNVTWKVIENDVETTLQTGKTISSDYYSISSLVVTPTKLYEPEDDIYHFSVYGLYVIGGGTYTFTTSTTNADTLYTEFSLSVHNQSTQDNPIPIYTYEELISMDEGEWYILQDDITLASDQIASAEEIDTFTPIETEIAGLDGNGYKIIFGSALGGTYTFTDLTNVGLFASVAEDMILSNVTVSLYGYVTFEMNTSDFQIGLIAAENNGTITNCVAKMSQSGSYNLTVNCSVSTDSSYVAGLVGTNNGYITNSRSSVNISSTDNLSGFVGVNSGHIASSYYRGGTLTNTTNSSEVTAGFVVENTGEIYASYVSGDSTDNASSAYYTETSDYIKASGNASGFVYSNSGTISDSYSNIYMSLSEKFIAGFVFENEGLVTRCISWSVLPSYQNRSYGFAYSNEVDDEEYGIYDCYYLTDSGVNESISELEENDLTQITKADLEYFTKVSNFENFAISTGRDINSVWFFNSSKNADSNFNGNYFNINRIELVAANIVATSIRDLESTTSYTDPSTGATYVVYNYVYSSASEALGSVYNPIILSTAENFETYILQENTAANYNYAYYRVVCDIDFSDVTNNCGTYVTKFMGYLEGNFMTLSSISLASSDKTTSYAGLFAEVGSSSKSSAIGTVMNLTLNATQIYFPSTNVVGGLTGRLDGGTLINITVTGAESVVGANIAGGIVGAAVGSYTIFNVYSTVGAVSRNLDTDAGNDFSSSYVDKTSYSFAGAIAGVLSGTGTLFEATVDSEISVLADKAGLMFGFVDSSVTVECVTLENQANNSVSAYSYGGLVVGETKGSFEDVEIVGTGESFVGFGMSVYIPQAIGTFAGLMSGGSVTNISSSQSVSISSVSTESVSEYLGLIGLVSSSVSLSNVSVGTSSDIVQLIGYEYVGGIIGGVSSDSGTVSVKVSGTKVYAELSALGIRQTGIGVGGIVGYAGSNSTVSVTGYDSEDSIVVADVAVQVTLYGTSTSLFAGAGAVVGYSSSTMSHSVANLVSEVDVSASVQLLSGNESLETDTSTLTISKDATSQILTTKSTVSNEEKSISDYMTINLVESTGTYTTGQVTFTRTQNCSVTLQMNVYGVFKS